MTLTKLILLIIVLNLVGTFFKKWQEKKRRELEGARPPEESPSPPPGPFEDFDAEDPFAALLRSVAKPEPEIIPVIKSPEPSPSPKPGASPAFLMPSEETGKTEEAVETASRPLEPVKIQAAPQKERRFNLKNRSILKQAVVYAEIFGSPRAFKEKEISISP